ncbi:NAD-dependent epimerase/dehydratase family protein [Thalassobaculum sp. OXR-137]|uniref:NAD-dependent epimerase/dehydratase family protein n=1 Tax=Thalassobaculum sp. OXR-137 TaxID=3100173 RepID=UPI0039FC89DF
MGYTIAYFRWFHAPATKIRPLIQSVSGLFVVLTPAPETRLMFGATQAVLSPERIRSHNRRSGRPLASLPMSCPVRHTAAMDHATPRSPDIPCGTRRVVVLGGTGTIGRATVAALLERGHRVICPVRPASCDKARR